MYLSINIYKSCLLSTNLVLRLKSCNRFYNRQFLTRKNSNSDVFTKFENLLDDYFKNDNLVINGIPSVYLSVSEIAYQLGFEHPQSFHRLFKNRTTFSPLEFRASFN
ncbi:AraC family transcriptional regulator [Chryseobacterium sp. BIGb0232]|uniref:helix-turn-helix domain-containing protein n=1 Tax=Chryseobacterium sp. BIGb0232 TaxID=2940598 RepID=UPI000F49C58C